MKSTSLLVALCAVAAAAVPELRALPEGAWARQHLGDIHSVVSNSKTSLAASDAAVGLIDMRQGALKWRHVFAEGMTVSSVASSRSAYAATAWGSAQPGCLVHSWNLRGQTTFEQTVPGSVSASDEASILSVADKLVKFVARCGPALYGLDAKGSIVWEWTAPEGTTLGSVAAFGDSVAIITISGADGTAVSVLQAASGVSTLVDGAAVSSVAASCEFATGDSESFLVCSSQAGTFSHALSSRGLGKATQMSGQTHALSVLVAGPSKHCPRGLQSVVVGSPASMVLAAHGGDLWQASVSGTVAFSVHEEVPVVADIYDGALHLASPTGKQAMALSHQDGTIRLASFGVFSRAGAGGFGVRAILKQDDMKLIGLSWLTEAPALTAGAWRLSLNDATWIREEALAAAAQTLLLEGAPAELAAEDVQGGAGSEHPTLSLEQSIQNDPAFSFLQRLNLQTQLIVGKARGWVESLFSLAHTPAATLMQLLGLVAEQAAYGYDKTMIILTKHPGMTPKIFAIRTDSGQVLWSKRLTLTGPGSNAQRAFIVASRSHQVGSALPEILVVQASPDEGSVLTWIDAWTGQSLQRQLTPEVVTHILQLPPSVHDGTFRRGVLCIAHGLSSDEPRSFLVPATPGMLATFALHAHSLVAHVRSAVGLTAFSVAPDALDQLSRNASAVVPMRKVWHFSLAPNAQATTSQLSEQVARLDAVGQPVGDDSVLLRYLNPHLLAVTTSSSRRSQTNSCGFNDTVSVFLLDAITGRVVVSRSHEYALGPAHIIRVANWAVYSYWNCRAGQTEMVVISLLAGALGRHELAPWRALPDAAAVSGNGAEVLSSRDRSDPSSIKSQAFVLPRHPTLMSATVSGQGVTPQQILVATGAGHVTAFTSTMIDPRRPLGKPTPQEAADRLAQYTPFLPLVHQMFVTRNITIPRIRAIVTAPTFLESTSVVAVAGMDTFVTRHTPVKPFDVLPSDFNRILLVALTFALGIGTWYIKQQLTRKQLKDSWT